MSKYIDLYGEVIDYTGVRASDIRVGIREALSYLDCFPDQVPGRTITEKEFTDAFEYFFDYDRTDKHREYLGELGITIVPDPEPTNAEKLERLYQEWRQDTDGMSFSVGAWMERHGVKAPDHD